VKPSLIPFKPYNASKINTPDTSKLVLITYLIVKLYFISIGEACPQYIPPRL
jgi:hypothetical protein